MDKKPDNLVLTPDYAAPPKPVVESHPAVVRTVIVPKTVSPCHCTCRCVAPPPPPPEKRRYDAGQVVINPTEERVSPKEQVQGVVYPPGPEVKLVPEPSYQVKDQKIEEGCPSQAH